VSHSVGYLFSTPLPIRFNHMKRSLGEWNREIFRIKLLLELFRQIKFEWPVIVTLAPHANSGSYRIYGSGLIAQSCLSEMYLEIFQLRRVGR
jgi:hypothetical protein